MQISRNRLTEYYRWAESRSREPRLERELEPIRTRDNFDEGPRVQKVFVPVAPPVAQPLAAMGYWADAFV